MIRWLLRPLEQIRLAAHSLQIALLECALTAALYGTAVLVLLYVRVTLRQEPSR